jgi:hypothetical protein
MSMKNPSFHLRYSFLGYGGAAPTMIQLSKSGWEIAGGLASVAVLGAGAIWLLKRKRPTEAELEQRRRLLLVHSGRIVDGMLLDLNELTAEDGRTLTMLLFNYRIGGVDYECSQDITAIREIADPTQVRIGFPCSVRYQPGNPQNSIVIAESWSGLREGLRQFYAPEDRESIDLTPRSKST